MKILLNLMLLLLLSCGQNTGINELEKTSKEYDIQDLLIQTRDGGSISGIIARKKGDTTKKAVILQYTIYVRDKGRDLEMRKQAVDRGYVGVIAYTRGKWFSPGDIFPYEQDANDTYDLIDWISQQAWCPRRPRATKCEVVQS